VHHLFRLPFAMLRKELIEVRPDFRLSLAMLMKEG
jgi:hypothetical protein